MGTPVTNLLYRVYESTSDTISTVAEMESNGTAVNSYTANISGLGVSGLNHEIIHTFNIIVKDEAGNKAAYAATSATTPSGDPTQQAGGIAFTGIDGNAGQIGGLVSI